MEEAPAERRTAQVHFRCLPSELAAVDALAEAAGLTRSEYFLAVALTGKRPKAKARPATRSMTPEAYDRLHDLGELLNSQARAVNRGRDYSPADILKTVIDLAAVVRGDEATAPLFRKVGGLGNLPPLSPVQWRGLVNIGNNLQQIADGVVFPEAAEGVRAFSEAWARALTVEAEHSAAQRKMRGR